MNTALSYTGQAIAMTVVAALLCATGYGLGALARWAWWIASSHGRNRTQWRAAGLFRPLSRRGRRWASTDNAADPATVKVRTGGAGRWWGPWGVGLTGTLMLLAGAWLVFDATDPYGRSEPGLWWRPAVATQVWRQVDDRAWDVALLALTTALTLAVVCLAARAGWRGLFGLGVPLADCAAAGAVASGAPVVRQLCINVGWPPDRDLQVEPRWLTLGALTVLVLWGIYLLSRAWRRKAWRGARSTIGASESNLATDAPARRTKDDRLGRDKPAEGLARLILDQPPPFVLGIDGEWGSGKSSLINMISDELHTMRDRPEPARETPAEPRDRSEKKTRTRPSAAAWNPPEPATATPPARPAAPVDPATPAPASAKKRTRLREQFPSGVASPATSWAAGRVVVVQVSLWEHQHDEVPAVAMLQAARDTLPPGARHEATEEIKAIMTAGLTVKDLPVDLGTMRAAVLAGRADRFVLQERQAHLSNRFTTVIDEVRRIHGADRVVFILDDLDRCLPGVALDLLEKIHLLLRETGCVTVVAIDTRVLELTVTRRYHDQGVDNHSYAAALAHEYVEKIFDFTYRIPPVDERHLRSFIEAPLTRLKAGQSTAADYPSLLDEDICQISRLFFEAIICSEASLRRTRHLVNSFIMYHSLGYRNRALTQSLPAGTGGTSATPEEVSPGTRDSQAPQTAPPESDRSEEPIPRPRGHDDTTNVGTLSQASDDDTPARQLDYHPFLMAAVVAIMVLRPEDYRKLYGSQRKVFVVYWFGLDNSDLRLDKLSEALREAIVNGMDRIGTLRQLRETPEGCRALTAAIERHVQMVIGPRSGHREPPPLFTTVRENLDQALVDALKPWMRRQRWFPVEGSSAACTPLGGIDLEPDAWVRLLLVAVGDPDSGSRAVLQVPLVLTSTDDDAGALTTVDGYAVHDGAAHPAFVTAWLANARGLSDTAEGSTTDLARRHQIVPEKSRVIDGEQFNTSVVLYDAQGPVGMLKILRRLYPGDNPEVDVPRRLVEAGWNGVPAPLGWLNAPWPGTDQLACLGALAQFIPDATNGFALACSHARDEASFTNLAAELGIVVAEMHRRLLDAYDPTYPADDLPDTGSWLASQLRDRFAWAIQQVPNLAVHADQVEARAAALVGRPGLPRRQRVHGDLHLDQVLRSGDRWYVIDFEGEPLQPLAERTQPDVTLRDVAGMLRSFDYAAYRGGLTGADAEHQIALCREAFWGAYCQEVGDKSLPGLVDVLTALELHKALYEVVYESRQRPAWAPIPRHGLDRLLATPPDRLVYTW